MRALAFLLLCLLCLGCNKPSEETKTKQMPMPPPPPSAEAATNIGVDIDGAASAAIDNARLSQLKPDFQNEERRAWKLSTLLGGAVEREGAAVAVKGEKGLELVVRQPKKKGDPIPVLALSRRGETLVAMVDEGDPFPAYHGHGGRLNRQGDPLPRIGGVTHMRVYLEAVSAPSIEIFAGGGKPRMVWTQEKVQTQAHWVLDGGAERDIWSLRDLAHALVGPKARVVAVVGEGGKRLPVETKDKLPLLKLNRGNSWKVLFHPEGEELKGITRVEIAEP
jgi:hypothetical protein